MWLLCGSASALLVTPHAHPPQHVNARPPRPRLLTAVMAEGSAGREGGCDAGRDPPDKLLDLVVQCAVQAQLAYHNEFKSEVRAKWLESFLGHEYLTVERIGGRECRIVYRGLSGLNDCSWRDYLGTMLRGSPQEYKCSYQVGTPDTAGGPGAKAQAAAATLT